MEKDCRKKKREKEAKKKKEEAKKKEERAPTKVSSSVLAALMAKLEGGTNMVVVDPTYSPPLGAISRFCDEKWRWKHRHPGTQFFEKSKKRSEYTNRPET